jgi:sulfate transport system ATP-binding protein
LRRLHDDLDVTTIFVTHDQEEALEVADRVVVMNKGQVEQFGSPQEVWEHPASPFVYGFLGDVNLFQGRAHEGEMRIGEDHHALRLSVPEHHGVQNSSALAYVRPYDLEVRRYSPGDEGIIAELSRAIVVGPYARLEFTYSDQIDPQNEKIIEAHVPSTQYLEHRYKEGESFVLTPKRAKVFVV